MEKKIINFNEQKFDCQKDAFDGNLETLNKISEEYASLGIGRISLERTREIISGRFGSIEAALSNTVEKEAKNNVVKDVFMTAALERLENFETKMEKLAVSFKRNMHTYMGIVSTPIEYFTINKEGRFEITDETWQHIKDERCTNYIHNEQEQKIHDALQALAAASNDFLSALGPNVKQRHFPPNAPWDILIFTDNGYEIDPETDYEYLTK